MIFIPTCFSKFGKWKWLHMDLETWVRHINRLHSLRFSKRPSKKRKRPKFDVSQPYARTRGKPDRVKKLLLIDHSGIIFSSYHAAKARSKDRVVEIALVICKYWSTDKIVGEMFVLRQRVRQLHPSQLYSIILTVHSFAFSHRCQADTEFIEAISRMSYWTR